MLETEPVIVIGDNKEDGDCTGITFDETDYDKLEDDLPPAGYCVAGSRAPGCTPLPDIAPDATTNEDYEDKIGDIFNNTKGDFNHTCDGGFTNWVPGVPLVEWAGIQPAIGRFTNIYFDFDGTHLHILNDWIYNDEKPVQPNCYNLFNAWTGNGRERWEIKVFGSGVVDVVLNGVVQPSGNAGTCGGTGYGLSPLQPTRLHSIFELSFAASSGGFGVQFHDPGPRFGCDVLETEPLIVVGELLEDGDCTGLTFDETDYDKLEDDLSLG